MLAPWVTEFDSPVREVEGSMEAWLDFLFFSELVVYYTGPYKASTINILWVCWSSRRTLLPRSRPPSCNSLNLRWTSVVRGTSGSVCVHPPPPLPPPPPPSLRASEELSCLGVIQKKMTVNATDDSYDKARQSMAQAEEETRSRGAIVIKHGGRYQGQCVTRCCTCSTAWQTAAVTETPPKKKKKPTVSHISGYHGNQWHSNSKSWFFWRYFITFFSVQFLPSNTGFSILCSNFDDF